MSNPSDPSSDKTPLPVVWLAKDGEPLPIDPHYRPFRTSFLARELRSRGFKVVWITSRFDHSKKVQRAASGRVVLSEEFELRLLEGCGYKKNVSIKRMWHYRQMARHFRSLARTLPRPDFVIATYPPPFLSYAIGRFAKREGIPLFLDVRDPWPDSFAEHFSPMQRVVFAPAIAALRNLVRRSFALPRGIISISNEMLRWSLQYARRERKPADAVFPIGYDSRSIAREAVDRAGFSATSPMRCVFVGMFGKSHDGLTLLRALRILEDSGERRILCRLIGDGESGAEWRALAQGLSSVQFTGWLGQRKLEQELIAAHVGLIVLHGGISKYWIGNKLYEYLAHGLAIVNSAPGDAGTLVSTHRFGTNVPIESPEAVAQSLKFYIEHPEVLQEHMTRAREVFEKEFSAERVYARYVDHVLSNISETQGRANTVLFHSQAVSASGTSPPQQTGRIP